jgi:hypothetical protein
LVCSIVSEKQFANQRNPPSELSSKDRADIYLCYFAVLKQKVLEENKDK